MAEETIIVNGAPLKVVSSQKYALNVRDAAKGLIMAILGSFVAGIMQVLDSGKFAIDWPTFKPVVIGAIAAGAGYLIKNFFTEARVIVSKGDTPADNNNG